MDAQTGTITPDPMVSLKIDGIDGEQTFDVRSIPDAARLDLLKSAVKGYIMNRVNQVGQRHNKDPKVMAWDAYDRAQAVDALQTTVAKPEGDRPGAPDFKSALDRAIEALTKGDIQKRTGEGKARTTVDPLVKAVSDVVAREVFESRKSAGEKVTFLAVKAQVGDGIAYLNKMIDAKVEAGADRAALEKFRDERYINPAKTMLGLNTSKKLGELPSIL